jgi:putative LysE/RhtB family amino acid efflux pump
LGGGILLLAFAIWVFFRPPVAMQINGNLPPAAERRGVGIKSFFLALGFTIINPLTILLFAAIFAGIDPRASLASLLSIVLGMFISALICWTVLALLTHYVRLRLGSRMMTAVNWLSAAAFVGFGVWAILSGFHPV